MATQLDFATRQLANPSAGVQSSLHDLGAMFGQFQQNKLDADKVATEQARYDTEQKRLGVLDARATTQYEQQQKERVDLLAMKTAVGQGLLGVPEDALTMGQQVQPVVQGVQVSPQEAYMSQGRNVVVPGTPGRNVVTSRPGYYSNPNPEIAFNVNKMVPGVQPKAVQPSTPGLETDYNKSAFTTPYRAVQGLISGTGDAIKKSWNTVNAPLDERMKALKPNLQEFVNPTGSTKVLGMTGRDSTGAVTPPPMVSKTVGMKTKLEDINLNTIYDKKGQPTDISKYKGDTYYKNKEGYLVNSKDVTKSQNVRDASYVEGKSEKTYVPGTQGYTKYISGTSNKEYIGSNGTTVPVKAVVGSVQNSINSYQDAVSKMTEGTTAKQITKISNDITRDVLKAHPELAHMAIDIQEMAKKGVGLKLPDGSLTKTEEMKLIAQGEDLKHTYDVQKENRGYDQARWLQNDSQGFQASQTDKKIAADRENSVREATAKGNEDLKYLTRLQIGEDFKLNSKLSKAERIKENEKIAIANAKEKELRWQAYKKDVGGFTDAYDRKQWEEANMPSYSNPSVWQLQGTWGSQKK